MKTKKWLAASIALGLTIGFGARILTGDEIGPIESSATVDSQAIAYDAAEGPWMHPAVTVVVKVPAKSHRAYVLASSTGQTAAKEAEVAPGTGSPWMHPAITVVVQVPARTDQSITVAASDAAISEDASEGPWMHPAITVVVQVPAKADRVFAMNGSVSAATRQGSARPGSIGDGTARIPGRNIRNPLRIDAPDFGQRSRGRIGETYRSGAGRGRGEAAGEVSPDIAVPRRPLTWDRSRGDA